MKATKRDKKPQWHNLSKADKAAYKRRHLIKQSITEDNTRAERRDAEKVLRNAANVHLGNKLLKPDRGFYNPTGKQTGSGGSIAGHQIKRFHT